MADHFFTTFDSLYQHYFNRSARFVRSYLHDAQAAEDIASECLIKLWEKMKTAELNDVRSYLFVTLKNRALDYLKREKLRHAAVKDMSERLNRELELRISTLASLDPQDIFSADVRRIIEETLEELPEKTRAVFLMSRFGGQNYKEIAADLGISVKGVDYHISKAMSAFKASLGDYLSFLPLYFYFYH